ncbi:MAG: type II toxin-antitoxin system VapC family toxin [Blastocatellia bacterium]
MSYLLDTGFLYASLNDVEQQHDATLNIIRGIREDIVLPVPAITEIVYLLMRDLGVGKAAEFVASLATTPLTLEAPQPDDYRRTAEIMRQYADAQVDFVDAIIVAIAERLGIKRILTLDQRDFRVIRPCHCEAFELLP